MTTSIVTVMRGVPEAIIPKYQTHGAAGVDLHAIEAATIDPGSYGYVGTGLHVEIPEGMEGQVRPRSGLAFKYGVTVLNAPGTIDSDYRGEVGVILLNTGAFPYHVKKGDRVAQMVFHRVEQVEFVEAEALNMTMRGGDGFGSTGIK